MNPAQRLHRAEGTGMWVVHRAPVFQDARGVITDVLEGTPVECVTILTSTKGAVRGNHFHKQTTQYAYVLAGRIEAYEQRLEERVQKRVLVPGDLLVTPPLVRHALVALEDSVLVVCTHGPRAGRKYESDTYRLETPLARGRG